MGVILLPLNKAPNSETIHLKACFFLATPKLESVGGSRFPIFVHLVPNSSGFDLISIATPASDKFS